MQAKNPQIKKFKDLYNNDIVSNLKKELNLQNIHMVPKITKIVLSMGVGESVQNSKFIEKAAKDLSAISCQRAVVTKAKRSIASFKVREGMSIGCKVTLRKERMYEFMERLVYVVLPRIKDFKGFSTRSFDSKGNFNFGIHEHTIFPEIDYDNVDHTQGMNISIVTTAIKDCDAKALLKCFYMPFFN